MKIFRNKENGAIMFENDFVKYSHETCQGIFTINTIHNLIQQGSIVKYMADWEELPYENLAEKMNLQKEDPKNSWPKCYYDSLIPIEAEEFNNLNDLFEAASFINIQNMEQLECVNASSDYHFCEGVGLYIWFNDQYCLFNNFYDTITKFFGL